MQPGFEASAKRVAVLARLQAVRQAVLLNRGGAEIPDFSSGALS